MDFLKKLKEAPPEAVSVEQELKRSKFFGWRDVVICLLIVGFFLLTRNSLGLGFGNYGGLAPDLEEDRFGVTDLEGTTHYFTYVDAEAIELRSGLKSFDKGERLDGTENRQVCSGTYRNSEFGTYQLHIQTKLNNYIVVHAPDGVLVFALESDETTKSLYEYFTEQRTELMK